MANRKAISKGTRFDVFHRDGFTCQYCGRRPPDILLEIDHIMPVAEGGSNAFDNLVTACSDCNLGKSAKLLEHPPQIDTDMAWLETQQELLELKRYQLAIQEKRAIMTKVISSLQDIWQDYSGLDWAPHEDFIGRMLANYDPEIIESGFKAVAPKIAGGYVSMDTWVNYLWATLKTIKAES